MFTFIIRNSRSDLVVEVEEVPVTWELDDRSCRTVEVDLKAGAEISGVIAGFKDMVACQYAQMKFLRSRVVTCLKTA